MSKKLSLGLITQAGAGINTAASVYAHIMLYNSAFEPGAKKNLSSLTGRCSNF
jgi:hypothetical protein